MLNDLILSIKNKIIYNDYKKTIWNLTNKYFGFRKVG